MIPIFGMFLSLYRTAQNSYGYVANLEEFNRHPLPKRPVMAFSAGPDVQVMRYASGAQKLSHSEVFAQADVMVSHRKHQLHCRIPLQKPWIADIRDVIDRVVEIKVAVVIPVHKRLHVEGATHRNAGRCHIRMFQGKVQRVVTSQTAACRTNLPPPADTLHERKNFVQQIALIRYVAHNSVMRIDAPVVKALRIDTVHAEQL